MTEEPQLPVENEGDKIQRVSAVPEKDYFLQDLVENTNLFLSNQIGITLQMHGILVSGTMISGDTYFDSLAQIMSSKEEMQASISAWGDHYKEDREKGRSNPDKETTFIHLRDCSFYTSTQLIKNAVLWRGRIGEVQGFFVGTLTPADK